MVEVDRMRCTTVDKMLKKNEAAVLLLFLSGISFMAIETAECIYDHIKYVNVCVML